MADRVILVPFEGEGSGVGELSWGQAEMWEAMRRLRDWLPLGGRFPAPPGRTIDDLVSEVRYLINRHPTLRTRLLIGPDGISRQRVAAAGEVPLEIVEVDPHADADEAAKVAEQVERRLRETAHDFVHDWPARIAAICHRGVLVHQVLLFCHLATDAAGLAAMVADLNSRDEAGHPTNPVPAMQPLAQARWQRGPAGIRHSEAALRHWERALRVIPPHRFGDSSDPRRPRYWESQFRSPAMHLAVLAIAGRTRSTTSTVLLTLFAVAQARLSGVSPAVTRVLTNNRFRAEFAGVIAPLTQAGLLVLDVAGVTVDEAVARAKRQSIALYKNAYYDPLRMFALTERISQERGEPVDIGAFFNDRRLAKEPSPVSTPPTRAALAEALARTRFRVETQREEPLERLFVHVDDADDAVHLTVQTDTHYLSPADLETYLHLMESLAVAAALDPATPTGYPG